MDRELLSEQVRIERKVFFFSLKENHQGRYLRVTEDVGGRRDAIIIPATGLEQVRDILNRTIKTSDDTPFMSKDDK